MLLSHPEIRSMVVHSFVRIIKETYTQIEGIAWVATWGIARWALVAEQLGLPFVYIRAKAKWHGKKNLVEGDLEQADRYLIIEDLISTGWSSLAAVQALQEKQKKVVAVGAIFSYEFPHAQEAFATANCPFFALGTYLELIKEASSLWYIEPIDLIALEQRREDPHGRQNN